VDPPCHVFIDGSVDGSFDSEVLWAFELGYRGQFLESVSLDATVFYNTYDDLASVEFTGETAPSPTLPERTLLKANFSNSTHGRTYGTEIAARWKVFENWRLDAGLTVIQQDFEHDSGHDLAEPLASEDSAPDVQFNLRSTLDLPWDLELDTAFYYVDKIKSTQIPSYERVDLRLGWRPSPSWNLSIAVQNVTDGGHDEAGEGLGTIPSRVLRSVYGRVVWRY